MIFSPHFSRRQFVFSTLAFATGASYPQLLTASGQRKHGILGQKLPPLTAEFWIDRDGKSTKFSMDELHNKWVFIKCFQSWCPGCHKYGFPTLQKVAQEFADHPKVAILAIQTVFEGHSINTGDKVREAQLRYQLPIKMAHDPGQQDIYPATMVNYRTGGTPWMVVADPSGTVIFNDFHIDTERFIAFLREKVIS